MAKAIFLGEPIGPGSGWFKPSQTAYDFRWLAPRFDTDRDGVISRAEFKGPQAFFDRLDRDHDGRLTPADFDWSDRSPLAQRARLTEGLFRRADSDGNGRISAEEWAALFKKAARGKDHLTPDDVRDLLYPPPPPPVAGKGPPGMPSVGVLLDGLISGEIGFVTEGPDLGQLAPDFRLKTQDGKRTIALSDSRDRKPVVLVFGSFT
jgi:hypothetical protein